MPGGGFESFLQTKIHPAANTNEADHVIRRALAMCRLCYEETSDNVEQVRNIYFMHEYEIICTLVQVVEKLKLDINANWKEEYTERNAEEPRLDKTNTRVKK